MAPQAATQQVWSREDDPRQAADRLLDAAGEVFTELGLVEAGVSDIARAAGCSRGTVHRYFSTGDELRGAWLERETNRVMDLLADRLATITDPEEMIVTAFGELVVEIAGRPADQAWFTPEASGLMWSLVAASSLLDRHMSAFVRAVDDRAVVAGRARPDLDHEAATDALQRFAASLLSSPPETPAMLDRLTRVTAVPMLLTDRPPDHAGGSGPTGRTDQEPTTP